MTEYVSLTDRRIATLKGHVLLFKARVPQSVPQGVEDELMAAGVVPVKVAGDIPLRTLEEALAEEKAAEMADLQRLADAADALDDEAPFAAPSNEDLKTGLEPPAQKSPEFDQAVFDAAVREIIARNNPDDLTPKGSPKVKAVEDITGFKVTPIHIQNFLKATDEG